MKSPGKVIIIIILSCVLYLVLGMVNSDSAFACAWYVGSDGNTNTGSGGGPPPNCGEDMCCVGGGPGGPGGPPPDPNVGDPVNVPTGNCIQTYTDLFVKSPGIPVVIERSYNNTDFRVSSSGWGWRFSLDMRVIFVSDNFNAVTHAVIINPDGRRDTYTKGTGDTFNPPIGIYSLLILNPDGTATLNTKDNLTYNFNQGGRLTEIRDLNGNTLAINYTDNSSTGEITTVVDSVGMTYSFTYENSKIKTITDPAGRQAIYTYNGGLLTEVTNPLNEKTTYSYDPVTYDLLTIKNNKGETSVTHTYEKGRVKTLIYGEKLYKFDYYDGYTDVTESDLSEQVQYTSKYYYNTTYYFLTKYVDPFGKETTYDWDITTKQLNSITDPLGNITSYTYYPDGKLWTLTQTISDTESKTTTYEYYDETYFSQIKSVTDPEGNVTKFTYTDDGKVNLYSIENPFGNITYLEEYNSQGQVTRIKHPNGKYTYITYDDNGYISSRTDSLNRTTYFTHDIVGNRTQIKDALNRATDYTYENFTRLDYITDYLGHITDFDYDLNGNLKKITDERGYDTHYEYNKINQFRFIKDHFGNIKKEFVYDSNNLWKEINASGRWIEYTYDALNRIKTKTLYEEDGIIVADTVTYTYDDAGRLTNINNTSADLTLDYDGAHRLTSVTTGGAMPGTTITYEYFKNDKRKKMTDAIGITAYTHPVPLDPTETIVSPNMGTFTITYDVLNRRDTMTLGNGIDVNYDYDDASQLTLLEYKDSAAPVTSHQYPIYDYIGNRKQEIDINGTHDFDYDELYRLTSATHPTGNPNESFSYTDPVGSVGNRTSSHLSGSYTYDELNRLQEDDDYIYGYDADGNLISKTSTLTSASTFYYYDAENKLVQVDEYDSTPTLISSSTYSYDGFGRRVKKSVSTSTSTLYYIYDNEDIRFETDDVGTITAEYVHGTGIDEPLAMRRGGVNYYYHVNGLGTITALTDSNKTIVQSYVYDSFGQIISLTGSITNPYTYTGREYDEETGLYYYRARYYDASIGRFISEDPIGLVPFGPNKGINHLYVYMGNNPTNFTDPYGFVSSDWLCPVFNIVCTVIGKCGGIWGKIGGKVCSVVVTYIFCVDELDDDDPKGPTTQTGLRERGRNAVRHDY